MFNERANPFDLLGIDAIFNIDLSALDQAYFERQALVHPDRFIYHSEPERQAASLYASTLNEAYETLKNPLSRAKALLKIRGIDVFNGEGKTTHNNNFLSEMMELNESLEEATSPHDLDLLNKKIQDRLHEVTNHFTKALQHENEKASDLFLQLSYLFKMVEDIKTRQRQASIKIF